METARNTENAEDSVSLWLKCTHCGEVTFRGELERNSFICPKCKNLLVLSIENRVKLLLGDDTSGTQFLEADNEVDVIQTEEDIAGYPVSLFILQSETALDRQHLSMFSEAVTIALEESIPLLSVFTASPIETECTFSDILPLMLQLEELADAALPHLTVLTETDIPQLTTHLPVGEIVIAENESRMENMSQNNPQPALHAPEEQLLPDTNRELTPDISVDCYVPRTELHSIIALMLKFFCWNCKND